MKIIRKIFIISLIVISFLKIVSAITIFSDDMSNFPTGWTLSGTASNYWTKSSANYNSASYSAKCTPNSTYGNNVDVYIEKAVNLTGYSASSMTFSVWQVTEPGFDFVTVQYVTSVGTTTVWTQEGSHQSWQQVSVNISTNSFKIRFRFYSNSSVAYEGAYIDDVDLVAGNNLNNPVLSWTDETSYTSDGLDPEMGNTSTTFVYRVKYSDADNDAPRSGFPKVHIKKGGTEISGSPFPMTAVDPADTTYTDGKLYTYSKTLSIGNNYTYNFESYDGWNASATGIPTNLIAAPIVTQYPTLFWTAETNYNNDGLNPEIGTSTMTFTYRVKYADADTEAPKSNYPKVHIKKNGVEINGSPFTMNYVSGSYWDVGVIFSYSITLSTGIDFTYYFEAYDVNNAPATGTPTLSINAPDITNSILSWTGETNYTTDGLDLGTGTSTTTFTYRIKYTDLDNNAPASGYPKLYVKKGGTNITGSPFVMIGVDLTDTTYTDGKVYFSSMTLAAGTDYTYYFEAYDVWGASAIGSPTNSIDAPDVSVPSIPANSAPTLSWIGETNYTSDGLDPETGYSTTTYTYRIKYTDADNDAPASGYPKLYVKKGGTNITGSPFTMTALDPADTTYTDGKLYFSSMTLAAGTDYTYYFEGYDVWSASATGTPITTVDAPDVSVPVIPANTAPTLSWIGEGNYISDGLHPEVGNISTTFIYRVNYTDADNDVPKSGYPKIHIKKSGINISSSPFAMSEVDTGDTTYTDGKLYTYSTTLSTGTDYTYYFEAYDVWNSSATGIPTTAIDAPDVPVVEISQQFKLYNNLFDPNKNEKALITYNLQEESNVKITICDVTGAEIKKIVDERKSAGFYIAEWNGLNIDNEVVASGLYIVYIQAGSFKDRKKILVIK
ncbi:MAG: T9SS type A sorting domain-containing protein [Elusimicrobia bacterium]|nr:T9SS type A sorting domain-containing protein [Elusimicrobiota bacterium]